MMGMDGFEWSWKSLQVEALIPMRVQGLPDDAGDVGFVYIHRNGSEWIGEAKGFAVR